MEWLSQADDRILAFLDEKTIGATPGVIAYNIDYHRRHIARRCRQLERAGLMKNTEGTIYEIAELGQAYPAGDVDAETLTAARPKS